MIRRGLFIIIGIICWMLGALFFIALIDDSETSVLIVIGLIFISLGSAIFTRFITPNLSIYLQDEFDIKGEIRYIRDRVDGVKNKVDKIDREMLKRSNIPTQK